MPTKEQEWRLIERLRNELNLGEMHITNSQILKATEGSYLRARVELGIMIDELTREISLELEEFKREILRAIKEGDN